jgi:hypothetical protein
MNPEIGIALGTGLISLGYHGVSCWGRRKRAQKLHKTRLSALIMCKHTGKSTLKKELDSHSSDLVIVDVGESVKTEKGTNEKLDYLTKANTYVKDLLSEFKTKKFLLLCESVEEAEHLNVDKANIFLCVPSNNLFTTLTKALGNEDKELKVLMEKSRMNLVRDCQKDQLNIFSSFDELKAVLKAAYKLENQF